MKHKCPTLTSHCIAAPADVPRVWARGYNLMCRYYSPSGKEVGVATLGHLGYGKNHINSIDVRRGWKRRGCGTIILDDMIKRGGKTAEAGTGAGECY